jgi:hypothetical protein
MEAGACNGSEFPAWETLLKLTANKKPLFISMSRRRKEALFAVPLRFQPNISRLSYPL